MIPAKVARAGAQHARDWPWPRAPAPKAQIPGYEVAGKTGTAEIAAADGSGYAKGVYVASFIGMVPADHPRLVVLCRRRTARRDLRRRRRRAGGQGDHAASPCSTWRSRRERARGAPGARGGRRASGRIRRDEAERAGRRGLGRDGARRPRPPRSGASPTTRVTSPTARFSFASPGSRSTGTRSPPRPSRPAPRRWSASATPASRAPQVIVPSVRRAMALVGGALVRRPLARAAASSASPAPTARRPRRTSWPASSPRPGSRRRCSARSSTASAGVEHPVKLTTAESLDLQRMFREMVDAGDQACAFEVSSHALAQDRAAGIDFDAVVFSNLTRDHLDYHKDLDDYFARQAAPLPARRRRATAHAVAVVNVGDEFGAPAGARVPRRTTATTCGPAPSTSDGATSRRRRRRRPRPGPARRRLRLHARLPAPRARRARDAAPGGALQRRERARRGDGRRWRSACPPTPCCAAWPSPRASPAASRRCAPGSRSASSSTTRTRPTRSRTRCRRRAPSPPAACSWCSAAAATATAASGRSWASIGARLADRAVITSDNPRTEEPLAIIDEIAAGVPASWRRRVVVEPDRRAAIRLALAEARAGDTVVIAGKGHEQGQIIGDRKHPLRRPRGRARKQLAEPARGLVTPVLPLTLGEVAAACGGRLESADPRPRGAARLHRQPRACGPATCSSACGASASTATSTPAAALAAGAAAVVVRAETAAALPPAAARIVVDDGLRALQAPGRRRPAPLRRQGRRPSPAAPARRRPRTSSRRCCGRSRAPWPPAPT